ncbi:Hemolysin precursor [Serratia rubidaea]|uniref:Hemolysin n=1 Tax=Serratia rubidaea TaxID=61652 RepID=A0A4U9HU38_SERRU|nr:Hemolysin precursor [Serratia rubidaea]
MAGAFDAADGIRINVKQDARYQGSALDGGSGKTVINAGGDIRLEQASDNRHESHSGFNVKASAKGGFTADSNSFGAGFGGGMHRSDSSDSSAQTGRISGKQGVALNAGRDLTLQGANVSSQSDVSLRAGDRVALLAAESRQTRRKTRCPAISIWAPAAAIARKKAAAASPPAVRSISPRWTNPPPLARAPTSPPTAG